MGATFGCLNPVVVSSIIAVISLSVAFNFALVFGVHIVLIYGKFAHMPRYEDTEYQWYSVVWHLSYLQVEDVYFHQAEAG